MNCCVALMCFYILCPDGFRLDWWCISLFAYLLCHVSCFCALLLWLKTKTTLIVFVPYSCMDTSSKSWLPHQTQFGLVGQAEVCCGGPGVLTPSECVWPRVDFSVCCTFTSSSPVCGAPLKTFCYICVINVQLAATSETHWHHCCQWSIISNSAHYCYLDTYWV